ncbi:MAG: DUF4189 domain-containing protein [Rhizobacter sp.]|nr:DUF4189 domain-containing protein [Burkholderiales bacterium]
MMKKVMLAMCLLMMAMSAQVFAAGAIAVDDQEGDSADDIGYGIGFGKTRDEAAKEAMKACRKDGNKNCAVKVRFDGCGAYAVSKRYFGVGFGKTVAQAERAAMDQCGRSSCKVAVSECDD